jgi:hypothetical protein
MVDSEVVAGMARISARDFGERVEPAKPLARAYPAKAPDSPRAREYPQANRDGVADPDDGRLAESHAAPDAAVAGPIPGATPGVHAAPAAPTTFAPHLASIKLLSGVNAGALVALTKAETTVGRPGVQVASIVKAGASFLLKPVEGASPPRINGKPVDREGVELAHGDTIEIAGSRLEFVDSRSGTAQQDVAA